MYFPKEQSIKEHNADLEHQGNIVTIQVLF